MVKGSDGKMKIVPRGWVPITEKNLPYELTCSLLLTPDAPGVPKPIKLQEQHRALFPLDRPITEESGRLLAKWAAGEKAAPISEQKPPQKKTDADTKQIISAFDALGIDISAMEQHLGHALPKEGALSDDDKEKLRAYYAQCKDEAADAERGEI